MCGCVTCLHCTQWECLWPFNVLMLQFLLPLSLAHALRECVYGELDHPLSTVISGPWTAVSGGSVRQRVDYG